MDVTLNTNMVLMGAVWGFIVSALVVMLEPAKVPARQREAHRRHKALLVICLCFLPFVAWLGYDLIMHLMAQAQPGVSSTINAGVGGMTSYSSAFGNYTSQSLATKPSGQAATAQPNALPGIPPQLTQLLQQFTGQPGGISAPPSIPPQPQEAQSLIDNSQPTNNSNNGG